VRFAKPIAFLLGVVGLFPLQARIDERKPERPSSLLYTPDRRLMKVIACGYGPFLADLVWIQSTGYVIREFRSGGSHIEHLYALYDVITELDPQYVDAYVMGAVFLSAIGNEPDRAIELLEKGEGRIAEVKGEMQEVTEGRVHPKHKERWKLLNETAAVHLVTYAGYATTLPERYEEIRTGGKLYLYAAKRYPLTEYPDAPPWYQKMGEGLTIRGGPNDPYRDMTPSQYYTVVEQVWLARVLVTPASSPLLKLYERRYAEIEARKVYEDVVAKMGRWKQKHGVAPTRFEDFYGKVPEDPLGVGYFLVDGKLVAPALDASVIERQLARDANGYHRANERWPENKAALVALAHREIPAWVWVDYDEKTGRVRAEPRPALVQPRGPK